MVDNELIYPVTWLSKRKSFPHCWPFVRGIQQSGNTFHIIDPLWGKPLIRKHFLYTWPFVRGATSVDSPHKGPCVCLYIYLYIWTFVRGIHTGGFPVWFPSQRVSNTKVCWLSTLKQEEHPCDLLTNMRGVTVAKSIRKSAKSTMGRASSKDQVMQDFIFLITVLGSVDPWRFFDMESLCTLLALCEGNPMVTVGFPSQRASSAKLAPGQQWIPLEKGSNHKLWCFLWCHPELAFNSGVVGDLRFHDARVTSLWYISITQNHCNFCSIYIKCYEYLIETWPYIIIRNYKNIFSEIVVMTL